MQTLLINKKAKFNFKLLEKYEAGISLFGFEVKSLREKKGNLDGAHVVIRGGEAYLLNFSLPAYQPKNAPKDYDPERTRKLLLNKKEIAELAGKESKKGLTIVPIRVYNKGNKIKIEIAVAQGKKTRDKREEIKKKDTQRDIERTLKRKY